MDADGSMVRGSSGLGWSIAGARSRWMIWFSDGVHALLSAEPSFGGSRVRLELVDAGYQPYLELEIAGSAPGFETSLLEQVVKVAVSGDLPLSPKYRAAWAIAIRTTAQELQTRGKPEYNARR